MAIKVVASSKYQVISNMIHWKCKKFDELTVEELYKILQLRNEVFVVEQNCRYQDCDGKDQVSHHLCGWNDGDLKAYTRLLPPGIFKRRVAKLCKIKKRQSIVTKLKICGFRG